MIRRKAISGGLGEQGFILGWLVKVDEVSHNQTMVIVFEKTLDGSISEQEIGYAKLEDGSPDVLPIIE